MVLLDSKDILFPPGTMNCRRYEFPIFKKVSKFSGGNHAKNNW